MANGLAIGLSLLAGVAVGWNAFLIVIPVVFAITLLRGAFRWTIVLTAVVCISSGALRGTMVAETPTSAAVEGSGAAVGVISSIPVAGGVHERAGLSLERIRLADGSWSDASGDVLIYLPERGPGVSLHDEIYVVWDATDADHLMPGYGHFVRSQGAFASATVWGYEIENEGPRFFGVLSNARRAISRSLLDVLPGDAGALASGIVTGDDSALSRKAEEAFLSTGTSHITSVSGQNVALLIGFMSLWMRPGSGVRRVLLYGGMVVIVWLYALVVGLEPPALRAATVATLTIAGAWSGRRPDPLTLLALTLGAMAMIDPWAPRSVGFWLSASASWALCTVVRPELPEELGRQLGNVVLGPLAATCATLPILIAAFDTWSPIAPLANALLSHIMTGMFAVTYSFALIALLPGPLSSALAWIPGIGLDLAVSIVERMATVAPQLHLDGIGMSGVLMVALPCMLFVMAFSRDSDRWLRMLGRL